MERLPEFFLETTKQWFQDSLGEPTIVQVEAWPKINEGKNTLVSAPTGTGKTLTAFLVFLDKMIQEAKQGTLEEGLQLIYISPLKSLTADIRENLKRPLEGIYKEERKECGREVQSIRVGIRTGDTTQTERRNMIKHPPHILITTPESLYLLLTSQSGRQMLSKAKSIIIDELHAVIDTKRGAHLMLSIARLDQLCEHPLQRIGLSATVEPLELAGRYLAPDSVEIVAPPMKKQVGLMVTSPKRPEVVLQKDSVWRDIAARIYEESLKVRSSIAFVEGRKFAEQLANYMYEFGGEDFARVHHGSLSKEQRQAVEQDLKQGKIRVLIATSTMELGIDVGEIDQVFQVGNPRTISGTMQRLGRAGHNPKAKSIMQIFPRTAEEALYCGMTAEVARRGGIEHSNPPRLCLDILAQHLVSMAANECYKVEEVLPILKRAYPFETLTIEDVRGVLRMLSGDYEHDENVPVRPRLLYDRIHDEVEGDSYSRMLAVSAGGTIPDRGMFAVKTEAGVKVGEVEEEFTFETRVGEDFLLGSFSWRVQKITKDSIIVTPSENHRGKLPFWKGDTFGRQLRTGVTFGKILADLNEAYHTKTLDVELVKLGLDEDCVEDTSDYIKRQIEATQCLPTNRTIIIEHYKDETGNYQMMVHSVFGQQVNAPIALLLNEYAGSITHRVMNYVANDDGMLIFPYDGKRLPTGMLAQIRPETARQMLEVLVKGTPTFNIVFRYNANRALMMGARKFTRQPLWVQRARGAQMLESVIGYEDHPLIRETKRECLENYWDIDGVVQVLEEIQQGKIQIREMFLEIPSPMSFLLRKKTEESLMYNYAPNPGGIIRTVEQNLKELKELIAPDASALNLVQGRKKLPEDEKQLHSLLMIEGDLESYEIGVPVEWLETLIEREQAIYMEPGLWIAAEQKELYEQALEQKEEAARKKIVLRLLRYRGDYDVNELAQRYLWSIQEAQQILDELASENLVECYRERYYHKEMFDRARTATLRSRRECVKTQPFAHYQALIANHLREAATPMEQLEAAVKQLCGHYYPITMWETVIFPIRVTGYHPEMLDRLLAGGTYYWKIKDGQQLCFLSYDDVDWEQDGMELFEEYMTSSGKAEEEIEVERQVCSVLARRGACFMNSIGQAMKSEPPYQELLKLASAGVVCADSFEPVRYLLNQDSINKMVIKQQIRARAKLMSTGRWDFAKRSQSIAIDQALLRLFEQTPILCRETVKGTMSWMDALEVLRIWEYTGKVRRGYFVEGLSGIQFIKEDRYLGIMNELQHPSAECTWLNATDPASLWGKWNAHFEERSYVNVVGNYIALVRGVPIAIFEKQGKCLRVFDITELKEALDLFVKEFRRKSLYPTAKRILVKEYPQEAAETLTLVGFKKEMLDYVLYR